MRVFWGLLGAVLSVGITWMIQTGRWHGGQAVPGMPGTTFADLDPRKIVSSFKNSVGTSDARFKNLFSGELSPDQQLDAVARAVGEISPDQELPANAENKVVAAPQGTSLRVPTPDPTRALSPSGARPDQRVYRYAMDIQRLRAQELDPYLGDWISQPAHPTQYVHLQIQASPAISNVSVRTPPMAMALNQADNHGLLWKDVHTGKVIVALSEETYLVLEGARSPLTVTVYQRGNVGTVFHRVMEKSLTRTTSSR